MMIYVQIIGIMITMKTKNEKKNYLHELLMRLSRLYISWRYLSRCFFSISVLLWLNNSWISFILSSVSRSRQFFFSTVHSTSSKYFSSLNFFSSNSPSPLLITFSRVIVAFSNSVSNPDQIDFASALWCWR